MDNYLVLMALKWASQQGDDHDLAYVSTCIDKSYEDFSDSFVNDLLRTISIAMFDVPEDRFRELASIKRHLLLNTALSYNSILDRILADKALFKRQFGKDYEEVADCGEI